MSVNQYPPKTDAGITQLTGDVTAGPGSGSQASTIANAAVTYAKIQNVTGESYLGRVASTSGAVSEVTLAASQLAGRGSSGDIAAISLGANMSMSGTTLSASGAVIVSSAIGLIQMIRQTNYFM